MRELLTVTCLADKESFLTQARSVKKYLLPCDVTVVLNEFGEQQAQFLDWFDQFCRSCYVNHQLTVLLPMDFPGYISRARDGYIRQQLIKILYGLQSDKKEYCILDSKNWFVRHTSLCEIDRTDRLPLTRYAPHYSEFIDRCRLRFYISDSTKIRPIATPYLMSRSVIKSLVRSFTSPSHFVAWFTNNPIPSEFMFYDLFAQSIGQEKDAGALSNFNRTFWPDCDDFDQSTWERVFNKQTTKIMGIHKTLYKKLSQDEINRYIQYLKLD